jgi:hypothetical protein
MSYSFGKSLVWLHLSFADNEAAHMAHSGQKIGDYELLQRLGTGPFTEVFLGKNVYDEKILFAIKTLSQPSRSSQELLAKRIGIASRLNHPAVIKFSRQSGPEPAFALYYAQQGSLRTKLAAGQSSNLAFIINCVQQIANALYYAHSKGIAHGNLKPENILFDKEGRVLLSDFDVETPSDPQLPSVLENLPHVAPEQRAGRTVLASDQFQLAYLVEDWLENQHQSLSLTSEVDSALRQVLRRAQAPNVAQRYPDIQAFAQALKEAAVLPPIAVESGTQKPFRVRRRVPLILSGVVLFLLLLLLGASFLAGQSLKTQIATSLTPTVPPTESPQMLYQGIILHTKPTYANPVVGKGVGQWSLNGDVLDGGCTMSQGTLHLISLNNLQSSGPECFLNNLIEQNFAFQAEMDFVQIDLLGGYMNAGLLLRQNIVQGAGYRYSLDTGFYNCSFTIQRGSSEDTDCHAKTGTGAANVLTVIALQDAFYLYMNSMYVMTMKNNQYQSGSLGVSLLNIGLTRVEVTFKDVKVWTL